jgi:hypothetical protein
MYMILLLIFAAFVGLYLNGYLDSPKKTKIIKVEPTGPLEAEPEESTQESTQAPGIVPKPVDKDEPISSDQSFSSFKLVDSVSKPIDPSKFFFQDKK